MINRVKQSVSQGLQWFLSRVQKKNLPQLTSEKIHYEGGPFIGDPEFFLGTKTGLLYFDGQNLWKLFDGRVYGITRYEKRWYTTWKHQVTLGSKPIGTTTSVLGFYFIDGKIYDLQVEAAPLDEEVHQIDAWNDHLYITDTANNRVLEYEIGESNLKPVNKHYPNGRAEKGKEESNYSHINSIFKCGEYILVMYHNMTKKTGKNSQIAVLNGDWEVLDVIDTDANSAHNIFCHDKRIVFCDSMNGRLVKYDEVLIDTSVYMRGLSVSSDFWLVGGSEHAKKGGRRFTDGSVYQYSPAKNEVASIIKIPNCGSLYEIRLINPEDLAISSISSYNHNHG